MLKKIHLKDIATFLNLYLSLYSIFLVFNGKIIFAGILVFINIIILDLLDGFIARLTKKSNELGKHLDSVTDFIGSSMVAPFFIYKVYATKFPLLAPIISFIPLLFGVLREVFSRLYTIKKENYFIGLPRNTAGLFMVAYVCSQYRNESWYLYLGFPLLILVSILQLSYWPYLGNDKKTLHLPTRIKVYILYAISMVILSLFINTFWETVCVLLMGYILSPPGIVDKQIWKDIKEQYNNKVVKAL